MPTNTNAQCALVREFHKNHQLQSRFENLHKKFEEGICLDVDNYQHLVKPFGKSTCAGMPKYLNTSTADEYERLQKESPKKKSRAPKRAAPSTVSLSALKRPHRRECTRSSDTSASYEASDGSEDSSSPARISPTKALPQRPSRKSKQLARIKLNENGPGGESSEEDVDDAGDKDDDFGDNATDKRQLNRAKRTGDSSKSVHSKEGASSDARSSINEQVRSISSKSDEDRTLSAFISKANPDQCSSPSNDDTAKHGVTDSQDPLPASATRKRIQEKSKPATKSPRKKKPRQVSAREKESSSSVPEKDASAEIRAEMREAVSSSASVAKKAPVSKVSKVCIPSADESRAIKLAVEDFVALRPKPDQKQRPLIGKVLSFTDSNVEVELHSGFYLGYWFTKTAAKAVRTELVDRSSVLMSDIQWTKKNKLSTSTVKRLRSMYEEVDSNDG